MTNDRAQDSEKKACHCDQYCRIHIYNTQDLLAIALPFHATNQFVRLVQTTQLDETVFVFLKPMQTSGAALPRTSLVERCKTDKVNKTNDPRTLSWLSQLPIILSVSKPAVCSSLHLDGISSAAACSPCLKVQEDEPKPQELLIVSIASTPLVVDTPSSIFMFAAQGPILSACSEAFVFLAGSPSLDL